MPSRDDDVLWRECSQLGDLGGRVSDGGPHSHKFRVAGPMWLGPLHDTAFLRAMQRQADARGWTGHAFEGAHSVKMTGHNPPKPLEQLLDALLAESDPTLPPWSVLLSDVCAACGLPRIPRRADLIADLQRDGFSAAATHAEVRPPCASPRRAALRCGPYGCAATLRRVTQCGRVRVYVVTGDQDQCDDGGGAVSAAAAAGCAELLGCAVPVTRVGSSCRCGEGWPAETMRAAWGARCL